MDHLNAHKHVSAKPVPNVIRGCLISFLMGYDRNDRNDKGNGKSYMRKIGRGLRISCHSCHLCHKVYTNGGPLGPIANLTKGSMFVREKC